MADLQGMARQVAEASGDFSLVTDYSGANYTPSSRCLARINSGQRWIDTLFPHPRERQRYTVELASGDYQFAVPGVRYIERIDLALGTTRYPGLTQRTMDYMRSNYAQPWGDTAVGIPVDWMRAANVEAQFASRNSFLDNDESGDWTYSGASWSNGNIVFAGVGSATQATWTEARREFSITASYGTASTAANEVWVWRFDQPLAGNDAVYIVGHSTAAVALVEAIEAGNTITSFVRPSSTQWGVPFTFDVSLAETPTSLSFEKATGTAETVSDIYFIDPTALVDDEDVVNETEMDPYVLIMPPANDAYTAVILGGYYADDFVDNTDTTWWSDKWPALLLRATLLEIEKTDHRNTQGVNDYETALRRDVDSMVMRDHYRELGSGPPEQFRMMATRTSPWTRRTNDGT